MNIYIYFLTVVTRHVLGCLMQAHFPVLETTLKQSWTSFVCMCSPKLPPEGIPQFNLDTLALIRELFVSQHTLSAACTYFYSPPPDFAPVSSPTLNVEILLLIVVSLTEEAASTLISRSVMCVCVM